MDVPLTLPQRERERRIANSTDGARHLFPTEDVFCPSLSPAHNSSRMASSRRASGGGGGAVFSLIIYDQAAQSQLSSVIGRHKDAARQGRLRLGI